MVYMNNKHIGMLAVFIAALMWALEPIFAKLSFNTATFLETSIIRAFVVLLIALGYSLISKASVLSIKKKEFSALFFIALLGTLFADLLYFYAFLTTSVLNAVLIGHLQPMFIIIISFFVLKSDKLIRLNYIGIILMMASAFLVSLKTFENATSFSFGSIGDIFVLCATITWAITAMIMRKYLIHMSASVITFYRFFIASIIFAFLVPFIDFSPISIYQIVVGITVGIGTICYYEGLKRLKAAQVSGIELSSPLFASIIGFLILRESVTQLQIIGMCLLFIGVYFISAQEFHVKKILIKIKNGFT
jgi:drug/metabolite transporter (DMT)-like permease